MNASSKAKNACSKLEIIPPSISWSIKLSFCKS